MSVIYSGGGGGIGGLFGNLATMFLGKINPFLGAIGKAVMGNPGGAVADIASGGVDPFAGVGSGGVGAGQEVPSGNFYETPAVRKPPTIAPGNIMSNSFQDEVNRIAATNQLRSMENMYPLIGRRWY